MTEQPERYRRGAMAVVACLAVGVALRLFLALGPEPRLIGSVADDAFYYTHIARNIARGVGPTMDGTRFTNGWHPLWMLVCVALQQAIGSDPMRNARALLLVSTLLFVVNAALLMTLVRRAVAPASRWAAPAAALFWAINPYVVIGETRGVETPLAMALGLTAILVFERARRDPSAAGWAAVGFTLGLAFLGRTDWGLLAPLVFFVAVRDEWRAGGMRAALRTAAMPAAAFVTALPWFAWNLARFGTIWQDSGRALMTRTLMLDAINHRGLARMIPEQSIALLRMIGRLTGVPGAWTGVVVIALIAIATAFSRRRRAEIGARPEGAIPGVLIALAAALSLFYVFVLQETKVYYFLPLAALLALGLAHAAATLEAFVPAPRARVAAAIGLAALVAVLGARFTRIYLVNGGPSPWQRVYRQAARDIRRGRVPGLKPGDRFGAFNSAILTAFSGKPFVNLDGVVNAQMRPVMRDRKLATYCREQEITIIVDDTVMIPTSLQFSADEPPPRFVTLAAYAFPPGIDGEYRILRLLPEP